MNKYITCLTNLDKAPFYLISRYDGRALQGKPNGNAGAEMRSVNENESKQLWVESDFGQQLINVGTNFPLQAGAGLVTNHSNARWWINPLHLENP